MAKSKPLTVVGHMRFQDGTRKPLDELTPEELARCKKSMCERLSIVMSEYYSLHPEEYERL